MLPNHVAMFIGIQVDYVVAYGRETPMANGGFISAVVVFGLIGVLILVATTWGISKRVYGRYGDRSTHLVFLLLKLRIFFRNL